MWNGKKKALTFSYDDGVQQDKRLIEIFNRYGMKATFNISAALLDETKGWNEWQRGLRVTYIDASEAPQVYANHEVAVHTSHHLDLTKLSPAQWVEEIDADKAALEALFGREVVGMAYPYGTYNDDVVDAVKRAGLRYARTIQQGNLALPADPFRWAHTAAHDQVERLFTLADEFLAADPDEPMLFSVWGHSYCFDVDDNWDVIERFCAKMAGRDDVAYVTNREALGL